jgi:hypothetical protein
MPLNEIRVDYNHDVAAPVREYRKTHAQYKDTWGTIGGRCVACFYYQDSTGKEYWMAQMSQSSMVRGMNLAGAGGDESSVKHAEQVLIDDFLQEAQAPGAIVTKVYTELQCCGEGGGMRNCRAMMEKFLNEHGQKTFATPVYYSFPYPPGMGQEKAVRDASIAQLKKVASGF